MGSCPMIACLVNSIQGSSVLAWTPLGATISHCFVPFGFILKEP